MMCSGVLGYVYSSCAKKSGLAHRLIPTLKGVYNGTIQELLDKDFDDLFAYTNAPASVQQELLDLFDWLYPGVR